MRVGGAVHLTLDQAARTLVRPLPRRTDAGGATLLTERYEQILFERPYSSVAQMHQFLGGVDPDPRFGASCVLQSLELAETLRADGFDDVVLHVDGRHVAVTCRCEGRPYLLDPYLLHAAPILLDDVMAASRGAFSAYPIRGGVAAELRVRVYRTAPVVSLAHFVYDPVAAQLALNRHFKLRLDAAVDRGLSADDVKAVLFHPEQNNLSIRVLDRRDLCLTDLIYPIAHHHGDALICEERLVCRTNEGTFAPYGSRDEFETLVSRICGAIGATREELVAFMLDGVRLYEEHAPAEIPYHPYSYTPA